ncbi:hypothetical protein JOC34_000427 [Virgibacillus halotolerans]|uniref:hypothetical protein n=1 Tax=Virgibacillus halotolerans TaxID=1071053 RepID=UPI0019606667|nr:hypothetical protein [Virgibacillus halotolerans]MBM7598070.1 hypothetical protein [Virgibacillus halotolerans]
MDELDKLPRDPYGFGEIWLDAHECSITKESFIKMFGETDFLFKYVFLYNHEATTPMWKDQFDAWKEQGILN